MIQDPTTVVLPIEVQKELIRICQKQNCSFPMLRNAVAERVSDDIRSGIPYEQAIQNRMAFVKRVICV